MTSEHEAGVVSDCCPVDVGGNGLSRGQSPVSGGADAGSQAGAAGGLGGAL